VYLDDHALAVLIANVAAPDNDLVADFSVHSDLLLVLIDGYAASGLRARRRRSRARSSSLSPPQIPCLIEFRSALSRKPRISAAVACRQGRRSCLLVTFSSSAGRGTKGQGRAGSYA